MRLRYRLGDEAKDTKINFFRFKIDERNAKNIGLEAP